MTRPRLVVERAEDVSLPLRNRPIHALIEQLHIAEDDVERRLDLVGGDGNELCLETVELRELGRHRSEALRQPPELVAPLR